MVRSILDGVALGAVHWAKVHNPTIVKGDHNLEQEVCITAGCKLLLCEGSGLYRCMSLIGQTLKGRSNVECSFRLAEGTEEDRFEGTSGGTHLQPGRPTDLTESTEFL